MPVSKKGIISSKSLYESYSGDILNNSCNYNKGNPFILTGNSTDIIATTDMYSKVDPGKTYYLTCESDTEWSPSHAGNDAKGKVTIWLYLLKTYDSSNYGFDNPICFTSSNWVKKGIWKYTISSGYNMARIRYNTYSDGSNSVTAKFWETHLIPEKYFIFPNELSGGNPKMRVLKDSIIASSSLVEI